MIPINTTNNPKNDTTDMRITETGRYRERHSGRPVDVVELEESSYTSIQLREHDDGTFTLAADTTDGDTKTFEFEHLHERYTGIQPLNEQRRRLPDDIIDSLLAIGYCPVTKADTTVVAND